MTEKKIQLNLKNLTTVEVVKLKTIASIAIAKILWKQPDIQWRIKDITQREIFYHSGKKEIVFDFYYEGKHYLTRNFYKQNTKFPFMYKDWELVHGETEIFESNKFFFGYGETRRLFPSNKSLFEAKKLHLIQQ